MTDSPLFRFLELWYRRLISAASFLQSPLLLLLRVTFGFKFYQTGSGKLKDLAKVTDFFTSIHIPFPKLNAILAGSTETFGGLLLLVGLGSRLISLPLAFTMVIAYATAEHEALGDLDKFLAADPFLFLLTALIVLAFGPGVFSLDWLIARFVVRRTPVAPNER